MLIEIRNIRRGCRGEHWEATGPWQTDGRFLTREDEGEHEFAAARGLESLRAGEAHEITFRIFSTGSWAHWLGVTDADAEFDVEQRVGGGAWGFAPTGCSFVATQNACRDTSVKLLDFDGFFSSSEGLVPYLHGTKNPLLLQNVEGMRVSVYIDWSARHLYFSMAGRPYQLALGIGGHSHSHSFISPTRQTLRPSPCKNRSQRAGGLRHHTYRVLMY